MVDSRDPRWESPRLVVRPVLDSKCYSRNRPAVARQKLRSFQVSLLLSKEFQSTRQTTRKDPVLLVLPELAPVVAQAAELVRALAFEAGLLASAFPASASDAAAFAFLAFAFLALATEIPFQQQSVAAAKELVV